MSLSSYLLIIYICSAEGQRGVELAISWMRPRFSRASFRLPCYIEPLAKAFLAEPPRSSRDVNLKSGRYGFGVHRFLDLDAKELSSSDSASSSESLDWNWNVPAVILLTLSARLKGPLTTLVVLPSHLISMFFSYFEYLISTMNYARSGQDHSTFSYCCVYLW